MKTPLAYHGGKQRLASWIVSKMPRHTVYVEPFFGGGAVFFAKPVPAVTNGDDYREVINDIDDRVIAFWQALGDPECCADLIDRIERTPYSRRLYEHAVDICRGDVDGDMAWAIWVAFIQSFGHTGFATKSWAFTKVRGAQTKAAQNNKAILTSAAQRLSEVYIECRDAIDVIKRWDSPQTLFYCDPPYPGTAQAHYSGYSLQDYQSLIDTLDSCQGAALVSCFPNVASIPPTWETYSKESSAGQSTWKNAKGGGLKATGVTKTELLYYKPRSGKLRPKFEKILQNPCFDVFPGE